MRNMRTDEQHAGAGGTTRVIGHSGEAAVPEDQDLELDALREELTSERDSRLRLAAEFDNYRRRVRREHADAANAGKRQLLEQLVSLADDLDLALANLDGASDAVAEALRISRRRFSEMLETQGVTGFESVGQKFDPERHDAFDIAAGTGKESGAVTAELRRGYFWNDKLLRPALVVVAQ